MKNYIKSLFLTFVLIFGFALFNTNTAQAGWNENYPGTDCLSVGIMLSNQNGTQSGCNGYTTSTSAGVNDVVNVQVYFRNTTANQIASNVVAGITHTRNSATSYSFTGRLTSSVGSISPQNVNLSIPTNTRLVFTGAKVYQRNGPGTTPTTTQQVTSTSALQNVSIGSVPSYTSCATGQNSDAFCYQGVLVASYRVEQDSSSTTYQCNDGIDNDGDGYIDYPSDAGCSSYTDSDEYNYNNYNTCRIDTFYPSNSTVSSGSTFYLYWQTTNCTTVTIDGVTYPVDGNGVFGPLYSGRTYVLNASNSYNNTSESEYVGVYNTTTKYQCNDGIDNDSDGYTDYPNDAGCSSYTDDSEYNYVATNPLITTLNPTNLTNTSGKLNGTSFNSGSGAKLYFEWGTSETNLPNTTLSQGTDSNGNVTFYDTLSNLQTGVTYYYRAVLRTSNGSLYRGEIKSFRLVAGNVTNPVTVITRPTIVTQPTVTNTVVEDRGVVVGMGTNLVSLRYVNTDLFSNTTTGNFNTVNTINNGVQNVCVDDTTKFVVEYRNISDIVLTNAILHIDIPKDVNFRSSSAGVYNKADNTITINVGTLNPGQEGRVSFDGVVLDSAANRDLLVVPATLSFENPNNGARETAVAYGLATTENCIRNSNLGGFAFGGGFFPNTLLGWLIIILVLLAILYFVRRWFLLTSPSSKKTNKRIVERHYEDLDVPTAPYHH
jgi:hypothetical protein